MDNTSARPSCFNRHSLNLILLTILSSSHAVAAPNPVEDFACGSRCVQAILQSHGYSTDLKDLIRELQWPVPEHGAALSDLATALKKRGIHAQVLHLSQTENFYSNEPAIFHLGDSDKPSEGHYVLWLPSSTKETTEVWDGIAGFRSIPTHQFREGRSGFVVITAATQESLNVNITGTLFDEFRRHFVFSVCAMVAPLVVCAQLAVTLFTWLLNKD